MGWKKSSTNRWRCSERMRQCDPRLPPLSPLAPGQIVLLRVSSPCRRVRDEGWKVVHKVRALSLFSGIGGLDLAAEMAGIETAAFCEIEPYAVEVLKRRWPGVPIIDDVRKIRGCDWTVDVVHGGFPCQDLSVAGKQAGLEGERSGLWFEMLRVISEIRPAFVLAENVRGAVNLALDTVQAGMEDEGYEVRTLLLHAAAFGAPHKRERMFVFGVRSDVADTYAERLQGGQEPGSIYAMRKKSSYEQSGMSGEGGGRLWPTPTSTERSGINPNTGSGAGLTHAVSLWRTPDANCMRGPSSEERMDWKRKNGMPISINDQVAEVERGALWPTPCSRGNDGGGPIGLGGGARARRNLDERVGEDARKKLCSGSLNPAWVEILMGFPLGWTDLDCDEPEPWPGWPALMGESLWRTPQSQESGIKVEHLEGEPGHRLYDKYTGRLAQYGVSQQVELVKENQHPYEPPRTVTVCPNRAKRLKCLGNAVVPHQARPIFEAIVQIHNFTTPNVSRETLIREA